LRRWSSQAAQLGKETWTHWITTECTPCYLSQYGKQFVQD
jgi:protein gp37